VRRRHEGLTRGLYLDGADATSAELGDDVNRVAALFFGRVQKPWARARSRACAASSAGNPMTALVSTSSRGADPREKAAMFCGDS